MSLLPDGVQIGPYWYRIKADIDSIHKTNYEGEQTYAAQIRHHDLEIRIDPFLAEDMQRESLLHEILHGVWRLSNMDSKHYKYSEESAIQWLSPHLLDVLQRNPLVTEWLTGGRLG